MPARSWMVRTPHHPVPSLKEVVSGILALERPRSNHKQISSVLVLPIPLPTPTLRVVRGRIGQQINIERHLSKKVIGRSPCFLLYTHDSPRAADLYNFQHDEYIDALATEASVGPSGIGSPNHSPQDSEQGAYRVMGSDTTPLVLSKSLHVASTRSTQLAHASGNCPINITGTLT